MASKQHEYGEIYCEEVVKREDDYYSRGKRDLAVLPARLALHGTGWTLCRFAALVMIPLFPRQSGATAIFEDSGGQVSGAARTLAITSKVESAQPFSLTSYQYLNTSIPAGTDGEHDAVIYTPFSNDHSWAALAGTVKVNGTNYTALDGAFDFYVCPNNYGQGNTSWFCPIDIDGISGATGMRITLRSATDNRVQLHIRTGAAHGLGDAPDVFTTNDSFQLPRAIDAVQSTFLKGTILHVGVTFHTDAATGKITAKLFIAPGVAPIDTEVNTVGVRNLKAMQTFYASAEALGPTPLPAGSWTLRVGGSKTTGVSVDYDQLRLYNHVPDDLPSLGVLFRMPPGQLPALKLPVARKAAFQILPAGQDVSSIVFLERDTGIGLTAAINNEVPSITLDWPAPDTAGSESIEIYRKIPPGTAWLQVAGPPALPAVATTWTDSDVSRGVMYEYKIKRRIASEITPKGYGYCYAGIAVPPRHNRGTAVLVVESSVAGPLSNDIGTLIGDLNGDGWTVKRHTVDAKDVDTPGYAEAVVNVRKMIQADYETDPSVDAVILLGHVPVPYSGMTTLDGHEKHRGAYPADGYYGDMTGVWTDTKVNIDSGYPWNRNIPGDGKFDQSDFPAPVRLQVGRIDLSNLPAFTQQGETAAGAEARLLRQYLNRNHEWRQAETRVDRRGVITDFWLDGNGTSAWGWVMSSSDGWRNLVTNVGRRQVAYFVTSNDGSADYEGKRRGLLKSLLSKNDYLWAFGSSWGTLDYANNVSSTPLLSKSNCRAVYMMLYASGIADWDCSNNLLRAHLAAKGLTLGTMYCETPHLYVHPMGMGGTLGECMRLSMNNGLVGEYTAGGWDITKTANLGLMGDPTLRQDMVAPPTSLRKTGSANATLSWATSNDAATPGFKGYYVYCAKAPNTPFTLLTPTPVTGTTWTDSSPRPGVIYMVRAARLYSANTGSYVNLSQGIWN